MLYIIALMFSVVWLCGSKVSVRTRFSGKERPQSSWFLWQDIYGIVVGLIVGTVISFFITHVGPTRFFAMTMAECRRCIWTSPFSTVMIIGLPIATETVFRGLIQNAT